MLESLSKDNKVFSFANQLEDQMEIFESFNQLLNLESSIEKGYNMSLQDSTERNKSQSKNKAPSDIMTFIPNNATRYMSDGLLKQGSEGAPSINIASQGSK